MNPRGVRQLVFGAVAIVATTLTLTGCGNSSANPSAATSPVPAAGAPPTAAGPTSAGQAGPSGTRVAAGSATPIDVCAIVSAAKASQLTGQAITTAGPRTGLQSQEYGCAYSNDDGTVQVQLTVFEHDAQSSYSLFVSQSKNVTSVAGLGDKAFFDNDATMYVLVGSTLIQVNGLDTSDQSAALARPLLAAL